MKPFLVDVPVLLFVFIRPDTLAQVFDVIKEARPSKLFFASDGPRENNSTDKIKIQQSREIVENIDWDCEVHRIYFDKNQGMYATFKSAMDYVFERVDRCIFLEDDVVTSISFFEYCRDVLEKYKDDLRINMVCGMNHLETYDEASADYFFTKGASIWGFALWKRTYDLFYDFSYGQDNYSLNRLIENAKDYKRFQSSLVGYLKDKNYNGHPAGPEFYLGLTMFSQNQLNIVPKKNMVCNIGYGEGNTHFSDDIRKLPKAVQKMFNMKTYEIEMPIKHPKYMIEDKNYEKLLYRMMGRSMAVKISRRIEVLTRKLYYDTAKILKNK